MPQSIDKDPDAVLDYKFDWANSTNGGDFDDWLESGETISSIDITAENGITVDSSSITDTNTSATVWLSGGTADSVYSVACKITTSAGRVDERTMFINVKER